jgi:hypothetical protein
MKASSPPPFSLFGLLPRLYNRSTLIRQIECHSMQSLNEDFVAPDEMSQHAAKVQGKGVLFGLCYGQRKTN